jgi:O-antigen ligase
LATRQPSSLVRKFEAAAAVVVVLMMSNALIGPLFDPKQTGGATIPLLREMWLPIYGVIFALAALRFRDLRRTWLPVLLLSVLLAWAFASSMWSIDPDVTTRRAFAVTVTTLFGVYLAASFGGRGMSEVLAAAFLILALGSYFVCLVFPTLGVHHDVNVGLWRGLWYEKNQMGGMMVYGALAAVSAAITSPRRRPLWILTLVLCAGLVVMTHSATSLISLLIVVGGAAALLMMGMGAAAAVAAVWTGVTAALALAGVYYLAPELVFQCLGKDASLTGRTEIWASILRDSEKQPLAGYGYAAFWGHDSPPAKWIRAQLQWPVPTAHNGWLDLLIQLGQIGVGIFIVLFGLAVAAAVIRHRSLRDGFFATLFLAVYSVSLQSESVILTQNGLPWVLAVAAMVRLLTPAAAPPRKPRTKSMAKPAVRRLPPEIAVHA